MNQSSVVNNTNVTRSSAKIEIVPWQRSEAVSSCRLNEAHEVQWLKYYKRLTAFKDSFGHCNITSKCEDKKLRLWCGAQRSRYSRGILRADREEFLNKLGFAWDWSYQLSLINWMKSYLRLKDYYEKHGHSNIPRTYSEKQLASWVWIQRQRNRGTYPSPTSHQLLNQQQISLLNELQFTWEREERWDLRFEQLKDFYEVHHHFCVPFEVIKGALQAWVAEQRSKYRNRTLNKDRVASLNRIGFPWDANSAKWHSGYQLLCAYHKQFGNLNVSFAQRECAGLYQWIRRQQNMYSRGLLNDEQIHLLSKLGFEWKTADRRCWEDRFTELHEFFKCFNHFAVPYRLIKLANFTKKTRTLYRRGELSVSRIQKLESIGFNWEPRESLSQVDDVKWRLRYQELLDFKKEHGHCFVTKSLSGKKYLNNWFHAQKLSYSKGKIRLNRKKLLTDIGFPFEVRSLYHWLQLDKVE